MWCMRPRDVIYKDYTHYVYYITYTPLYDPCKFFAILPMGMTLFFSISGILNTEEDRGQALRKKH
jgi:hypothetical protein